MPAFRIANQEFVLPAVQKPKSKVPGCNGPGRRREHRWLAPKPHGQTYQAGDSVRQSGIYEAIHEGRHRAPHEVVMIEADLFPPCDTCADRVRFRLIRTAPYIFTDEDFEAQK